ncbi:MAG: PAS domain-containing sensor histidine kinase [Pseudomonadaceae bacterium]|nr:PAS domain-containing sensor histidine kinase [Pseudomonadaceae bacterium]
MKHTRLDIKVLFAAIVASIAVMLIVLTYQHNRAIDAVSLAVNNAARLITSLPSDALTTELRKVAYDRLLAQVSTDPRFAYAAVTDSVGRPIATRTSNEISVLPAPSSTAISSASWINHLPETNVGDHTIIEAFGPLASANSQAKYRVAFFQPKWLDATKDVAYLASIILPIFLLTPLLLLLLRREVTPLEGLAKTLSAADGGQSHDGQAIGTFVEQFNSFMDQAQQRIDSYQNEKDKLITSERFLNYRLMKLESILHAINSGIAIVDTDDRITFANELFSQYIGGELESLTGKNVRQVLDRTDLAPAIRLLNDSSNNQPSTIDVQPSHLAGATLRISSAGVATNNAEEPVGRVLVMQDVSGEILARNSRGEFVGHVSHELKTPLNTLALCAQSLQGPDGDDDEYRHETLNIINDEVERLALLINNLLSITQIEMGTLAIQPTRVKISELITQLVDGVQRSTSDKKLRYSIEVADNIDTAQLDKSLMTIALNNLLTNATKYSEDGGAIRVSVLESDESLQFSVTDTGIGIPENELDSIFDKFCRGKGEAVAKRNGHGLGLALVRDIVELHHGSIRVQSRVGSGSKFTIDLWKQAGILEQAI